MSGNSNWWGNPEKKSESSQEWWREPGLASQPGDGSQHRDGSEHREEGEQGSEKKRKFGKKTLGAIYGGLGAVASLITILAFVLPHHSSGPPTFDADLTQSARQFTSFLNGANGKVVRIDIQCGMLDANGHWAWSPNSQCIATNPPNDSSDYEFIMSLGSFSAPAFWSSTTNNPSWDRQTAWVQAILVPNTGAYASNGNRGAGWTEVEGYFSVDEGHTGNAPPGSQDFVLTSVSQTVSTQ